MIVYSQPWASPSPFISSKEIDAFISQMAEKKLDTLISVADVQIECIYENNPINFVQRAQTPPSQDLTPVSYTHLTLPTKA